MTNQVIGVTIKGIGDFSDVVSNVGSVQKALTKLKLPDKLGDSLNKNIANFYKEYDKYQKKIAEGIHTQGDQNAVNKSLNSMLNSYEKIINEFGKLSKQDFKDIFNLDEGAFASVQKRIKDIQAELKKIKIDPKQLLGPIDEITKLTKAKAVSGSGKGVDKIQAGIDANDIFLMKEGLQELETYYERFSSKMSETKRLAMADEIKKLKTPIEDAIGASDRLEQEAKELDKQFNDIGSGASRELGDVATALDKTKIGAEGVVAELKKIHEEEFSFNRQATDISRQIQQYFGLTQIIRKVGDIARDAFATVKELDAAMTQTAVVTNFSVGDMWEMLPTYTAQANQLGSTIKDVYDAATLYYQQGLNTNQAMSLANETLKMARIAGLDAADATNMMTAALRGFNMEINQQSAQKINDIYSELAAITASDTKEIGSAMERTASIANSANMEFATTSAFLAQMIETTREAPENLGTAMKTIVARFQEMKQDPTKLIDSEGVAMDANKVDKALKTIGVQLMDTKGEFRDLDDVFLEIASKWDSLSQGQQRYIATIAAGSRQQSRFIAMMSNYERTMELVDAANNSAGASQRQFEKTLDSMEAKLNKLKNAWDQFTMGLMNNQILKFGVSALTEGFTVINKFIDILGKIPPKPFEGVTKSLLTLVSTVGLLKLGGRGASALSGGIFGWLGGEGFSKGFNAGWARPGKSNQPGGETNKLNNGIIKQSQFSAPIIKDINSGKIANAIVQQFNKAKQQINSIPWNTTIAVDNLIDQSTLTAEGKEAGHKLWLSIQQEVNNGTLKPELATIAFQNRFQGNIDFTQLSGEEERVEQLSSRFDGLGTKISSAGMSLQQFGSILQGTPLEPFGNLLMRIGVLMVTVGDTAVKVGRKLVTAFMEAKTASIAAGGGLSGLKAGASAFIGVFTKIPPHILLIIAAITAAIAVAHHFATANKRALEAVTDAAAAASEAYDSAKQETSELADAIEQVKTNEDAFDGLVVGTAAFNEQLVNANEQIMELIKKYPMLNDPKYLSTDKNGLMHISDEGLDAVKEYQKQRQANASALNLIQTADLNSEETRQKAAQMRKVKGTDTTETLKQRQQEADLLEQQAKAQADMAKVNAVNTALVDKEIHNREKVSAIMAEQYDARKNAVSLEGESIHDLKQEYADFYGYKYDKSTKKLTDVEGNEIDVDKATIKDAVKEIRVITNFEADGKSLDSMLNSIDSKFSNALGDTFVESGNLFSDIMSNNIDIDGDLLENLITNPDKLQNAVDALSEKEIAAVLGVSADAVAEAPDKYKNELTDKLAEKATNIAETQAQSYADLASMLAQTTSADVSQLIDENGQATTNAQKANQQAIKEQLDKLTTEQKNTLSSIGNALSEGAGAETMRTFIRQATDIYTKGTQESITALDSIITDVNWSSPTARLKAYNDMINSADKDVQNLGNSLRNSSESSNLLGEAFEEFYDSSDFQEMAENMDKFADSSGKLNASSIQEMAKECGSLNNLLDTGAISAGGVAAALNAMGADGNITILDLNENLLKFLSTANQLEDTLAEAHSLIENFDWGVDTGESEDFAKESTKKWKELYDNGEFGNQQLENYAKFVLGQERWNNELEKSGGNIEKALNNMSGDILKYSDGFEQAWVDMANSSKDKYNSVYWENGDIQWDTQGKTTQELVDWLAETRGITQEWAKLMVEDFANYSYDFKTELAANDFNAALKNGDYITSRKGAEGNINITQGEIQTLAAAQNKTEQEITAAIAKSAGIAEDELNIIKNIDDKGNVLMGTGDIASLNTQYSQAELGKDTTASWISQYVAQTRQGQNIEGSTDLKAAISGAIADGFQADQANEMARTEALKAIENGAQVFYDGVELQKEDLADSQAFADKITEITENSRWNAVGEAIAQGYIAYIKGTENPNQSNNSNQNGTSNWEPASYGNKGSNITIGTPTEDPKEEARRAAKEKFDSWIQGLKEGTNTPTEDPKIAAGEKSRQQWSDLWASIKQAFTEGTPTEDPKVEAAEKARTTWKNIWDGVKQAFNTPTSTPEPKQPQGNTKQSTVQNQETTVTIHTEDSELDATKAKIDTVIEAASKPQTVTITANTGKSTDTALTSINKIKEATKGNNIINVNAKVKGKDDVNNLGTVITNVKPKTISVTANVSGASKVTSLRNEISNLKDKDVYITTHKKTVNDGGGGAKGINNYITPRRSISLGSLASGTRYGRLGPRGRGGLTLTGEEGFEIAWLPSESRSMILGADGPQMINLPSDAVVYTHEQSKDILRKKQTIDAGSHAGRHISGGSGGGSSTAQSVKKTSNSVKKSASDAAAAVKKVSVWWENIARKTELAQRIQDKNQKAFEKYLKEMRVTLRTTGESLESGGGGGDDYLTSIGRTLGYYEAQLEKVNKELKNLDTAWAPTKQKDRKKLYGQEGHENIVQVSYKNGKNTKEDLINLAGYIKQEDGTYVVDQKALDKIANKDLRKAVADAANKEINDRLSKKYKAEDEIEKAQEAIEKMGEELYKTFFGWEVELTKIWNITQKIEQTEARISQFKGYSDLLESQLSTGMATAGKDFAAQSLQAFQAGLQQQMKQIDLSLQSLDQKRTDLSNLISLDDEKETLTNIQNKLIENIKAQDQIATTEAQMNKAKAASDKATKDRQTVENRQKSIVTEIDKARKQTKTGSKSARKKAAQKLAQLLKEQQTLPSKLATAKNTEAAAIKAYENAKTAYENASKGATLNDTEKLGYEEYAKELEKTISTQAKAWEFMTATQMADGTVNVTFDSEAFEAEKFAGNITEEQGKAIQDYVKSIVDESKGLSQQYVDATSLINDMYGSLSTLQDSWADYANELWDISEAEQKKEVENAKKLSDSITNSLKNLLDEVKRKLDERRQQEDNAKTERDISQKQQRLAMLRADTAGGHQVDIAQLEREIAEAQQSYQRSLEDQLLDKLQQQADLAAEQRERQIALQEATISEINNAAQVNQWMSNPEAYRAEIYEAFKAANDYDKKPEALQAQLDNKFNTLFNGLLTNQQEQALVTDEIKILEGHVEQISTQMSEFAHLSGAITALAATITQTGNGSGTSTVNKPTDLTSDQTTANRIEATVESLKPPQTTTTTTVVTPQKNNEQIYKAALAAAHKAKTVSATSLKDVLKKGSAAGRKWAQVVYDLAEGDGGGGITWDEVMKAAKKAGYKKSLVAQWRPTTNKNNAQKDFDKALKKFKRGGIADFTGPAWLDGTPSKPELVLNATDTKNFLALRDVLSSAMRSTSAVTNSYGGDVMYDINIHVDKIEKDYDVDRVVDKVKKEIVKGAGYRNVTQVRNFK